jgi:prophage DNA circulation protein
LNSKVDDIEINIEPTVTSKLEPLQISIDSLQEMISALNEEINSLKTELNELKGKAITEIVGTENEIDVIVNDNKATIKFADNARFVAGDSNNGSES